jgi:hypothetical protein
MGRAMSPQIKTEICGPHILQHYYKKHSKKWFYREVVLHPIVLGN